MRSALSAGMATVLVALVSCSPFVMDDEQVDLRHGIDLGLFSLDVRSVKTWSQQDESVRASLFQEGGVHQWLLKLDDPSEAELLHIEAELGILLRAYLPVDTYIVASEAAFGDAAEKVRGVRWVGLRQSRGKVSQELDDVESLRSSGHSTVDLHVSLLDQTIWANGTRPGTSSVIAALSHAMRGKLEESNIVAVSADKLEIKVPTGHLSDAVKFLASLSVVSAVQKRPDFRYWNKNARRLVLQKQPTWSAAWDSNTIYAQGITGSNQIVGVSDSGLDMDNCLFYQSNGMPINTKNANSRKVMAYLSYSGSSCGLRSGQSCADLADDEGGHGTHVCGSVAGSPFGGTTAQNAAASEYSGIAKDSKLIFTDIGNADGSLRPPSDLYSGLYPDPMRYGAYVHTNSWGSPANDYDTSAWETDKYMYENDDFLVLFAAGNDGDKGDNTVGAPATAKNILCVGASETSNNGFKTSTNFIDPNSYLCRGNQRSSCCSRGCTRQDCCNDGGYMTGCCQDVFDSYWNENNIAEFSSRGVTKQQGSAQYGRWKPDLVAPGSAIVSARANGGVGTTAQCNQPPTSGAWTNVALQPMDGTSMATPVMAGAAALVRQYFLDGFYPSGRATASAAYTPSAALMKAILINGAQKLTGSTKTRSGTTRLPSSVPNKYEGFGQPALDAVLRFSNSNFGLWLDDNRAGIATRGVMEYMFTVTTATVAQPFVVTLVWTDPAPGSVYAYNVLVNDLDLTVVTSSKTYYPNSLNGPDRLNNAERISVTDISRSTTVTVKVSGYKVGSVRQKFAVVVTGQYTSSPSGSAPSPAPGPGPQPGPGPAPAPKPTPAPAPAPTPAPSTGKTVITVKAPATAPVGGVLDLSFNLASPVPSGQQFYIVGTVDYPEMGGLFPSRTEIFGVSSQYIPLLEFPFYFATYSPGVATISFSFVGSDSASFALPAPISISIYDSAGAMTLTYPSPTSAFTWPRGQSRTITWDNVGNIQRTSPYVVLSLQQNGNTVSTIAAKTPNDGSFVWAPDSTVRDGQYQIRVDTWPPNNMLPDRYKMYAISGTVTVKAASGTLSQTADVKVTMRVDISEVPENSRARAAFSDDLVNDLAVALVCSPDRIVVRSIVAGSIVVTVRFYPSSGSDTRGPDELAKELTRQAEDPTSPLYQQPTTSSVSKVDCEFCSDDIDFLHSTINGVPVLAVILPVVFGVLIIAGVTVGVIVRRRTRAEMDPLNMDPAELIRGLRDRGVRFSRYIRGSVTARPSQAGIQLESMGPSPITA
mmetsp:Transcript_12736/g.29300  ORF Transcript_12736/g.29300 Transcript_12736/m.29300 type:complete len:1267 (+) Transcript_12736:3-3803(+)